MTERESIKLWSVTAASNNSADPSINWLEGQLPSTVNNSARAVMAALARHFKDTNGSITTGGSANAYTLTANATWTAYATGQIISFKASFPNTGAATINVTNSDAVALGAKAIRSSIDTALEANAIISGGHYLLQYDAAANSAAGAWILIGNAPPTAAITQAANNLFWNTARVNRLNDRVLIGDATTNDGAFPFTILDWFSALSAVAINGGDPLLEGVDLDIAQVAILPNGDVPPTQSGNANLPAIGLLAAAQTADNVQPRAIQAHIINNPPGGSLNRAGWAIYGTATRFPGVTGNTFWCESDVRNSGDLQIADPYTLPNGGTYNFWIAAGSGASSTGQNDVTAAMVIGANPMKYTVGINFVTGGIGAHGPGGSKSAIAMPYDNSVQWFASAGVLAGSIRSDSSSTMRISSLNGIVFDTNLLVPNGSVLAFGDFNTYIGGDATSDFINVVINGVEKTRVTAAGLTMPGTSSGTVTIAVQAAAGTYNWNLPTTAGSSGQILTSGGGVAAPMTWTTLAAVATSGSASDLSTGTLPAGRMPALTGDVTTSAGAVATTLATVNSNVGTFGSATKASVVTVNAKGLVTVASESTVTPAVGNITGLGTGVATALAVNTGTDGAFVVKGGALGTPSSGAATNLTSIPVANATGVLPVANGGNSAALSFSGYRSTNQTPTATTWVKVQIDTETTDPSSWFDNATNYRFLPNVAGVYMIVGQLNVNVDNGNYGGIAIYKNGASVNKFIMKFSATDSVQLSVPAVVTLNGSTDYIELFGFSGATVPLFTGGAATTDMQIYRLA